MNFFPPNARKGGHHRSRGHSHLEQLIARRTQIQVELLQKIKDCTIRQNEANKAFVTEDDLFAAVNVLLHSLLEGERLTETEIDNLCQRCYKIISILVWIGAASLVHSFSEAFYDSKMKLKITDEDLPFDDGNKLPFLNLTLAMKFIEEQSIFQPIKIEDDPRKLYIWPSRNMRLPWKEENLIQAAGDYGQVVRVKIPKGYFVSINSVNGSTTVNQCDKEIACKRIGHEKKAWPNLEKELETLSTIKNSVTTHEHIMTHIGFLIHDSCWFILLPLALGDLESFLNEGRDEDTWNLQIEHDGQFASIIKNASPYHLLNQIFWLASALEYLHQHLESRTRSRVTCVHMDLKPSNVMIVLDNSFEQSPVGSWKLSDFGISMINVSESRQEIGLARVCDETSSVISIDSATSRRPSGRSAGTYTAPEVQRINTGGAGPKSDVWALTCIFCEVFAFALGRWSYVSELRAQKAAASTGGSMDSFYIKSTQLPPGNATAYFTNPEVLRWLDLQTYKHGDRGYWVGRSVLLIKWCLIVDYHTRPDVRLMCKYFGYLFENSDLIPRDSLPMVRRAELPGDVRFPVELPLRPFSDQIYDGPVPLSAGEGSGSETRIRRPEVGPTGAPMHQRQRSSFSSTGPISHRADSAVGTLSSFSGENPLITAQYGRHPYESGRPSPQQLRRSSATSLSFLSPSDSFNSNQGHRPEPSMNLHISTYFSRSDLKANTKPIKRFKLDMDGKKQCHVAASLTGDSIAWLGGCKVFVSYIYLNGEAKQCHVELQKDIRWDYIAIAGDLLAVAGSDGTQQKVLHVYDLKNSSRTCAVSIQPMHTLNGLAVSTLGKISLASNEEIILFSVNDGSTQLKQENTLKPLVPNQNLECVKFSLSGRECFAWSWGQGNDMLHSWNYDDTQDTWTYRSLRYKSRHRGLQDNDIWLLPFEELSGCVTKSESSELFCACFDDQPDQQITLQKNVTNIANVLVAKVFLDKWLITIEQLSRSKKDLKRYNITLNGQSRKIEKESSVLARLKSNVTAASKLEIIRGHEQLHIIICNADKTIEPVSFDMN